MTSQCCPTTSTLSSTSLLREAERSESTPRFESIKDQPARRSESRDEASESCPGADVERCAGVLRVVLRDDGLRVGDVCDIGRWRIIVIAYMGLLRTFVG